MATQRCPKCKSNRVRLGYRPTSNLFKILFRYNLLCDECNWEFTGFAIPGTVSKKTKKKKSHDENRLENKPNFTNSDNFEKPINEEKGDSKIQPSEGLQNQNKNIDSDLIDQPIKKNKIKKKVRIKLF